MTEKKGEQPLSEILHSFIQKNNLQHGIDKVAVNEVWKNSMGKGIMNYTTGIELRKDTLYVSLSSSVLREELSLGTSKIIDMLNTELGKDLIKKLVLR